VPSTVARCARITVAMGCDGRTNRSALAVWPARTGRSTLFWVTRPLIAEALRLIRWGPLGLLRQGAAPMQVELALVLMNLDAEGRENRQESRT
jgi:hypothetical protein